MGFTLETGIFCSVFDGKTPVGYCFDCCYFYFIFDTSPPGYEPGNEESEEAANRRRGLLNKVYSQERAIGSRAEWSDSTSVRKPILRN
jgi:hypothetical protein